MVSFFSGDPPAHTISIDEWWRWVGVRSISIACNSSNNKGIISFNYYKWHEIPIDFSHQTKSRSRNLPRKRANSLTWGSYGARASNPSPPLSLGATHTFINFFIISYPCKFHVLL